MLLLSILFHAFTFYLVQATYPISSKSPPPSAKITILNPVDPHSQELIRWIERMDPAVIIRDSNPVEPSASLTDVPYQASYERVLPELYPIMESVEPQSLELVAPPRAVRLPSRKSQPAPPATPVANRSKFRFLDGLALASDFHVSFDPPKAGTSTPSPVVFLVAVDSDGNLRHAFLQHSSGSEALDAYAGKWLREAHFSKSAGAEKWGHVAILWGSEVFD